MLHSVVGRLKSHCTNLPLQIYTFARWKRPLCTVAVEKSNKEVYLEQLNGEYKGIVVVNLNRPSKKNALGKVLLSDLNDAISQLEYSSPKAVQVALVRSCVDNVFCAGADLKERAQMSDEETLPFVRYLRSTFTRLEAVPMPTIAVVDGFALGGGTELALACDLRVAGKQAVLGLPETTLAILPGAGGTQRLPRLVGIGKAKELVYTGARLNAEEARKIGLVERIAQGEETAFSCALSLAKDMLKTGPVALRLAKQAIRNGSQVDILRGLEFEDASYARVIPTKDRREALSAFAEKRKPQFRGE
ncbi:hypothetical protein GpartN1_g1538.t1 [Galdieria partita]|uniref:Enoyl-CoA hydratase n=1 Tax=Galdieria partita TaxID=83374 RepID=A0A9C7PU99_9RHOD|nr:hypothetical protein GpartN1_g491.t1 [Galdieria partita]GJQ09747.1 hypothetical protein GpartN1_g1538.t1 [Galdieria partita]